MKKALMFLLLAAVFAAAISGCGPKRFVTTTFWNWEHLYIAYWEEANGREGAKLKKCDLRMDLNTMECREQDAVARITAK